MDRLWRLLLNLAYRAQLIYWFVFRPTEPSAHVAVWWEGRLLILHSSYKPHVSLPAGGIKRRETPVAAACRELREEVGIAVAPADLAPVGLITARQQFKEDQAHVFELRLTREPQIRIDRREVIGAEFAAPAQVLEMRASEVLRRYLLR